MSLLFFSNPTGCFMFSYVPCHFFKVPFDFACLPKAAFCKDKVHRGTVEPRLSGLVRTTRNSLDNQGSG